MSIEKSRLEREEAELIKKLQQEREKLNKYKDLEKQKEKNLKLKEELKEIRKERLERSGITKLFSTIAEMFNR